MSSWSLLIASQGQILEGPQGLLGFKPKWQPEDHRSFWTGAEGWGSFTQKRGAATQKGKIEVAWGRLRVRKLVFALPEGKGAASVSVKIGGQTIEHSMSAKDRLTVTLSKDCVVEAGGKIDVEIVFG